MKVGTKSVSTYEGHQQMQLKCMSMIDDMVLHTYYNTKHISDKTKNKNKKNTKRISRLQVWIEWPQQLQLKIPKSSYQMRKFK